MKQTNEGHFVAIPKCYYCNESKDELLLSTRLKDISAAHDAIVDMEPCSKCKEFMKQGVILVSIRDGESKEGNPPNPYRTGGWWVITVEAANRIFNIDFNQCIHFAFIEDSAAEKIGLKKGG